MDLSNDRGQLLAWRLLLAMSNRVASTLDRQLQSAHGVSLVEFEVLDALRMNPAGVRMTLLAEQASVSKSRLSHCVDRLSNSGYVQRDRVDGDRRGLLAVLTNDGRKVCDAAAQTHAAIRQELLEPLFKVNEFASLLPEFTAVAERVRGAGPTFA